MQMIWVCVSTRCRKYRTIDWLLDYSKAQKLFCAFLCSVPHRFLSTGGHIGCRKSVRYYYVRKGKNMKKILALLLAVMMVASLCAVSASADDEMTVGLITLHDENSGYDKNFIDAFNAACEATGVKGLLKTGVGEDQSAYDAAAELADSGCTVIFTDSYGHQSYILSAAEDFPEVQFTSCTGDMAQGAGLDNYHNAFAPIFTGRYLAGVAAGLKLQEMIDNGEFTAEEAKVGYVGAMPYAEVISGYTSWFLGVRSVVPTVTMDVVYTGSWYDETLEKEGAEKLIQGGCKLISQHADSMGAPTACETAGVPNVSYNGSTIAACPNTYIISSRIDWQPYFEYAINAVKNGENYDIDSGDKATAVLTELNEAVAAEGTQAKLDEVKAKLISGEINVFDTSAFTVNGEALNEYKADVDYDPDFTKDTEVVSDGYFHESEYRSAPYFDILIDGITEK